MFNLNYIIFKRFTMKISPKKEWKFTIFSVKIDSSKFHGMIENLIEQSKFEGSIYNVYVLSDYGLDKVAYINKGKLFTL